LRWIRENFWNCDSLLTLLFFFEGLTYLQNTPGGSLDQSQVCEMLINTMASQIVLFVTMRFVCYPKSTSLKFPAFLPLCPPCCALCVSSRTNLDKVYKKKNVPSSGDSFTWSFNSLIEILELQIDKVNITWERYSRLVWKTSQCLYYTKESETKVDFLKDDYIWL